MKLDIAKKDVAALRDVLTYANRYMKSQPNPSAFGDGALAVPRKVIKKLNAMLKKMYGHDCGGDYYLKGGG